jgi:predicted nuclease of restriction endonuclease-like RecB superfamily
MSNRLAAVPETVTLESLAKTVGALSKEVRELTKAVKNNALFADSIATSLRTLCEIETCRASLKPPVRPAEGDTAAQTG